MKNLITITGLAALCSVNLKAQTFNNVGTSYPSTPAALNGVPSQLINAQDNQILFQGSSVFGNDAARNNVRLGIGVFNTPINGVVDRLHLNDIGANAVFSRFTNQNTQQTSTDGFIHGIDASGNGVIKQFENLPILFYTNATERMRLLANGNVGVNNTTGNNRLEITSGTGNPYFSSGYSSGLRFTNLTDLAPATSTANKVLSVDGNGDVILVSPIASGTIGSASSKNGLNSTVGAPDVELGGPLVRSTEVDLNGLNLVFNKTGRFGVGGNVTIGNLSGPISTMNTNNAKIVFDNGDYEETQRIYANAPNGYAYPFTRGLFVQARNTQANTRASGANGVYVDVGSDAASSTGFYASVRSSNDNVVGASTGIITEVVNGIDAIGGDFNSTQSSAYESNTSANNFALNAFATGGYNTRGICAAALNSLKNVGGYFDAQQTTANANYILNKGIYAQAANGPVNNIGVDGFGSGGSFYPSAPSSIGVYGHASYGQTVIGIKGEVPVNGGSIAGTSINLAGFFDGDVLITGSCTAASFPLIVSDKALKTNIKPLENALDVLAKLSPKSYNLTNENCKQLDFTNIKTQYGLIAQEVESVFPDIVYTTRIPAKVDSLGKVIYGIKELKGVSYEQLISLLIKGSQEQQKQITDLTEQVQQLTRKIENTSTPSKNATDSPINTGTNNSIELSDKNVVFLDQNIPNPFFESTTIKFALPANYKTAKIVFTGNDGKLIKSVDLSSSTGNSLTVYANSLSNGVYNYSLYIDDQLIDTKRMVKD